MARFPVLAAGGSELLCVQDWPVVCILLSLSLLHYHPRVWTLRVLGVIPSFSPVFLQGLLMFTLNVCSSLYPLCHWLTINLHKMIQVLWHPSLPSSLLSSSLLSSFLLPFLSFFLSQGLVCRPAGFELIATHLLCLPRVLGVKLCLTSCQIILRSCSRPELCASPVYSGWFCSSILLRELAFTKR